MKIINNMNEKVTKGDVLFVTLTFICIGIVAVFYKIATAGNYLNPMCLVH